MHFVRCLSLFFLFSSAIAEELIVDKELFAYAENTLTHSGVLTHAQGFVYLDVEDAYIHELISFIELEGFEKPPYFGRNDLVGAHITVVYPDEVIKYGIETIDECGMAFPFTLRGCKIVHPLKWKEMEAIYCLIAEVPELDRIREKYELPPKQYDFHISIGVKRRPLTPFNFLTP